MMKLLKVLHLIFPIIFVWIIINYNKSEDFEFWILISSSIVIGIFNLIFRPINKITRFFTFTNNEERYQYEISNKNIQFENIKIEKVIILAYSICIITLIFILQFVNEGKYYYQQYFIQFFLFTLQVVIFSKFLNSIKALSKKTNELD